MSFETPWEELAQAYEALPASDQKSRHAYLLKIAEIWERGQHDVGIAGQQPRRRQRPGRGQPGPDPLQAIAGRLDAVGRGTQGPA